MKRSTLSRSRRCSSLRVRFIGSLRRLRLSDGRVKACGVDHHSEFLKIMCVTELVKCKCLIDRGGLSHDIDRTIDCFLGQLQCERRLGGYLLRQSHHERGKLGPGHNHAKPMRFLRAPDISGEEKLLSLSRTQLPWMNEPFDPADAHGDN